jgi:hypothetical protein
VNATKAAPAIEQEAEEKESKREKSYANKVKDTHVNG